MQLSIFFFFTVNRRCSIGHPFGLVGSNGLGPSTSRLSGVCSNQLSYEPIWWR